MKQQQNALRRRCRQLAKRIGCVIDPQWMAQHNCFYYWVIGPADVYGHATGHLTRDDPWDDHAHANWRDVLTALETYEVDIFFHHQGVGRDETDAIAAAADAGLLRAWMDDPDSRDRGPVLADWLEDQGLLLLSEVLRCQHIVLATESA